MFSQYEGLVAYYGHGMSVANEETSARLPDAIIFHVLSDVQSESRRRISMSNPLLAKLPSPDPPVSAKTVLAHAHQCAISLRNGLK
jgi:hypothetical protein